MPTLDNSVLTYESMQRTIERLQRYSHPNTATVTVNVPNQFYPNNSFVVGMDPAGGGEEIKKMPEEPEREPTLREVWAD